MPFVLSMYWFSSVCAFFMPRAFAITSTLPSWTVIIGLMLSSVPANAIVAEILPPFFRYSSVSMTAYRRTFFFAICNCSAISWAESPWSRNEAARQTRICNPAVAFKLSTANTFPSNSSAAICALCAVPDSSPDSVKHTTSSPFSVAWAKTFWYS